jgi:hypothetical protein
MLHTLFSKLIGLVVQLGIIACILTTQTVWANTCELSTDYDFDVEFSVSGSWTPNGKVLSVDMFPNVNAASSLWQGSNQASIESTFNSVPFTISGFIDVWYKVSYQADLKSLTLSRSYRTHTCG